MRSTKYNLAGRIRSRPRQFFRNINTSGLLRSPGKIDLLLANAFDWPARIKPHLDRARVFSVFFPSGRLPDLPDSLQSLNLVFL